jgi:metal-responsive CopG/Arc/MetJ family transcriptional regulator
MKSKIMYIKSFFIPDQLNRDFKAACRQNGEKNQSQLLRSMIQTYVDLTNQNKNT